MDRAVKHQNSTINDVAAHADVSKATVSRVINNLGGVSPALEKRVKDAISELKYKPNKLARALAVKQTNSIGLIIPFVENAVFGKVARIIENISHKYGYSLILCNSEGKLENEIQYLNLLAEKQVDGIIFDAMGKYDKRFTEFLDYNIPTVLLGKEIENFKTVNVTADNHLGGYSITEYLIKTGCRKIVFIHAGEESFSAINERFEGYKDALADFRIPLDPDLIVNSRSTFNGGSKAVNHLIKNKIEFDAIFAGNDLLALGCLDELLTRGFKIPDDVSVFGYDDIPFASMVRPRLSTVYSSLETLCNESITTLLELIENPGKKLERKIIQPQIILRQSTRSL